MFSRRVTQHVRDQIWTAIGIDLVIVTEGRQEIERYLAVRN
ncbi:MAG: hypothetical protein ACR2QS_13450 [Woeseiaceae bacterium]